MDRGKPVPPERRSQTRRARLPPSRARIASSSSEPSVGSGVITNRTINLTEAVAAVYDRRSPGKRGRIRCRGNQRRSQPRRDNQVEFTDLQIGTSKRLGGTLALRFRSAPGGALMRRQRSRFAGSRVTPSGARSIPLTFQRAGGRRWRPDGEPLHRSNAGRNAGEDCAALRGPTPRPGPRKAPPTGAKGIGGRRARPPARPGRDRTRSSPNRSRDSRDFLALPPDSPTRRRCENEGRATRMPTDPRWRRTGCRGQRRR